jgi:hypothetical protein
MGPDNMSAAVGREVAAGRVHGLTVIALTRDWPSG